MDELLLAFFIIIIEGYFKCIKTIVLFYFGIGSSNLLLLLTTTLYRFIPLNCYLVCLKSM